MHNIVTNGRMDGCVEDKSKSGCVKPRKIVKLQSQRLLSVIDTPIDRFIDLSHLIGYD
jgi:hypothetical protein